MSGRLRQVVLLLVLLCAGCATRAPQPTVIDKIGDARSPFEVAVLEEAYDGETLALRLQVKSVTYWDPTKVILEVAGLKDGGVVHTKRLAIADVADPKAITLFGDKKVLRPGGVSVFPVVIPMVGISDYQIQLAWGDEAHVTESVGPRQSDGKPVTITDVRVNLRAENCSNPPCLLRYEIEAVLENVGSVPLRTIDLAVGFAKRGTLDLPDAIPQNEVEVSVGGTVFVPGERRPMRVLLDQLLTKEQAQQVEPRVRVFRAEP